VLDREDCMAANSMSTGPQQQNTDDQKRTAYTVTITCSGPILLVAVVWSSVIIIIIIFFIKHWTERSSKHVRYKIRSKRIKNTKDCNSVSRKCSVCVCVQISEIVVKRFWWNFMERWVWSNDQVIRFSRRSGSRCGSRNFFRGYAQQIVLSQFYLAGGSTRF